MSRLPAIRATILLAAVAACVQLSNCSCNSTRPESAEPDPEREQACSDSGISKDAIVVDFHDDVSRSTVDSFAARNALSIKDTVPGANSYILLIDRAGVPPTTTAMMYAAMLRDEHLDSVLLVEAAYYTWIDYFSIRYYSIQSTEHLYVEFESPALVQLDSIQSRFSLTLYPREEWLPYMLEWFPPSPPDHFYVLHVDRNVVPIDMHARCIAYDIREEFGHAVKYVGPTGRRYKAVAFVPDKGFPAPRPTLIR